MSTPVDKIYHVYIIKKVELTALNREEAIQKAKELVNNDYDVVETEEYC